MNIAISVIIATHNRCFFLQQALEGLARQSLPIEQFEVIVVDNASSDHTREYVLEKQKRFPVLRYLYEEKPGANHARNIGWQQAKGEYVAYLDDDAIPGRYWLEGILHRFKQVLPQPGIVGGKVIPLYEHPKPHWIQGKLLKALSVVDYGEEPRFLRANEYLYSVNMTFQRKLLESFGGFDVALGRSGKMLTSNDEILIAKKIRAAGYQFYYDPQIAVEHHIAASRLNHQWFIRRYISQGYSDALMWKLLEKPGRTSQLRHFLSHIYIFIRNPRYFFRLFYVPQAPDKFYLKLIAHAKIGYLKGLFSYR